jgi:sulfatase modifying factor 1
MSSEHDWLLNASGGSGDIGKLVALAEQLQAAGDVHIAATALDRAFGLDSNDAAIRQARKLLLDQLSLTEHGIVFRYVPAGTFLMGSEQGDADERPVHGVQLDYFWISETPISWGCYCRVMDWEPPPNGMPKDLDAQKRRSDKSLWNLGGANKIRLQYCEDETRGARDWHAHLPEHDWKKGTGETVSSKKLFGEPNRGNSGRSWGYDEKPMVCVGLEDIERFCLKLSLAVVQPSAGLLASILGRKKNTTAKSPRFRLPTEAEWEKAARGGLIGKRYAWGDEEPGSDRCDFNRFDQFSILPMKRFAANDYGLYAVSGGVWEWTSDWYDAEYYAQSAEKNPSGPVEGKKKVVRGGSWSDCAEAVSVSFRMSMGGEGPPVEGNPNIGFRVCRGAS